jgi:hypothetical protein
MALAARHRGRPGRHGGLTVLQFPVPRVRLALWRDPDALAAGQWWRLVMPLLVQYDPVWQIVVVLVVGAGRSSAADARACADALISVIETRLGAGCETPATSPGRWRCQ